MKELKNRGLGDILIAAVDGLKGFPEAISAVFPQTIVQTCIVHLIRHSLEARVRVLEGSQARRAGAARHLSGQARRGRDEGMEALEEFETGYWGQRYPAIALSWRRNWQHVVPFFAFPESVRRINYTTNQMKP